MRKGDIGLAFESFRRLNIGGPSRGTGLRLPLNKALVEANGALMTFNTTLVEVVFPPARILAE